MAVTVDGELPDGVTAKDLVLAIIGQIGTGGGAGHIIEYRGSAIRGLSMEGRMTVCNMSIEAGARAGMIAPDDTTFAYLEGRDHAPKGAAWDEALAEWRALPTDEGASFDREVVIDASTLAPYVTWGTNPAQVTRIDGTVPDPGSFADPAEREAADRALDYMGLVAGTAMRDIAVDTVFIGSCTNGRIEDLRAAADVLRDRRVQPGLRAMVVPGSHRVKAQAESEGLDAVFTAAGFDWREPGCSMCLAMNPDKLAPGERSASTSNRNFEGRQGRGGRTHLVSPAVAAATAVAGHFAVPGDLVVMRAMQLVSGRGVPLDRSDVDTDQIIPSDWLKRVERTGFGAGLFAEWRDDRDFVLNQEEFAGANILVAGPNFGTGSSREHAVWALQDYGFEAVVSPRFGDIFRNNCTKAGLVPVQVDALTGRLLLDAVMAEPTMEITIDIDRSTLEALSAGIETTFPLDEFTRARLLNGWDDIGLTLRYEDDIEAYEALRPSWLPTTR